MTKRHTIEFHGGQIRLLLPNEIFVFGSNEAGRHGAGAAKHARLVFGAKYGVGHGPTGHCYAIPTKTGRLQILTLTTIAGYVKSFLDYAAQRTDQRFLLTAIGCGLAGYRAEQIAPLFLGATQNVVWPPEFADSLATIQRASS